MNCNFNLGNIFKTNDVDVLRRSLAVKHLPVKKSTNATHKFTQYQPFIIDNNLYIIANQQQLIGNHSLY